MVDVATFDLNMIRGRGRFWVQNATETPSRYSTHCWLRRLIYPVPMNARLCIWLLALPLVGCDQAREAPTAATAEYQAVLKAVFAQLPDAEIEHRKWLEVHPSDKRFTDIFVDPRWCVAQQTAGEAMDFRRPEPGSNLDPAERMAKWQNSSARTTIPRGLLPSHLRWVEPWSLCPYGMVRLGNPSIRGDTASVYFRVSGRDAMEGQYLLRNTAAGWILTTKDWWWVS